MPTSAHRRLLTPTNARQLLQFTGQRQVAPLVQPDLWAQMASRVSVTRVIKVRARWHQRSRRDQGTFHRSAKTEVGEIALTLMSSGNPANGSSSSGSKCQASMAIMGQRISVSSVMPPQHRQHSQDRCSQGTMRSRSLACSRLTVRVSTARGGTATTVDLWPTMLARSTRLVHRKQRSVSKHRSVSFRLGHRKQRSVSHRARLQVVQCHHLGR